MRAHRDADRCHSGCLKVGRSSRVNDGSVGCLFVYRRWIFEMKVCTKVEALLDSSLGRIYTLRSPDIYNHLHTEFFVSDFAVSSASHLATFASFLGLRAFGGVASRRLFLQFGGRPICAPCCARLISSLVSASCKHLGRPPIHRLIPLTWFLISHWNSSDHHWEEQRSHRRPSVAIPHCRGSCPAHQIADTNTSGRRHRMRFPFRCKQSYASGKPSSFPWLLRSDLRLLDCASLLMFSRSRARSVLDRTIQSPPCSSGVCLG